MDQLSIRFRGLPTICRGAAAFLAACLVAPAVWADEPEVFREPGWIPSFTFGFDTFDYEATSTVVNFVNPPAQEDIQSKRERQLLFKIGAELMGPAFEGIPGRPRLFVQGGVQLNAFSSDEMFRLGNLLGSPEGDIQKFQIIQRQQINRTDCEFAVLPEDECIILDEGQFLGQGSEVGAKFENPSFFAALGVAFHIPMGESVGLLVKPSLAYQVDQIDFSGKITTVTEGPRCPVDPRCNDDVLPGPRMDPKWPDFLQVFDVHRGRSTASTFDHSVGPGLELVLSLFRAVGPVQPSLFVDARFLWLVSGRTNSFSDAVGGYTVERDGFGIRGGAGVRFSWVGFGER